MAVFIAVAALIKPHGMTVFSGSDLHQSRNSRGVLGVSMADAKASLLMADAADGLLLFV